MHIFLQCNKIIFLRPKAPIEGEILQKENTSLWTYIFAKLIISKDQRRDLIKIIELLPREFSVKEFKDLSKLSRKYTIPFLEFLDKQFITKKINNEGLRRRID